VYSTGPGKLGTLLMMPEWYLLMIVLVLISGLSAFYEPLRFATGLLVLAFLPPATHAWLCGQRTFFRVPPRQSGMRLRLAATTALLHFLQPAARLVGRFRQGLTPWRRRGADRMIWP